MAILTMTPGVALAIILCLLLVIGLAAFHRRAAENLLQFFTGLLDLYQRWQQAQRLLHREPKQNVNNTEPLRGISSDRASAPEHAAYPLLTMQQRDGLQRRESLAPSIAGGLR